MRKTLRKFTLLRNAYKRWLRFYLEMEGRLAVARLSKTQPRQMDASSNLAISLTTYGARLGDLNLVLESLLRQDITESYRIAVHLSGADLPGGTVPTEILQFEKFGIKFHVHSENVRSYKKLIYEYENGSDTIVVTADDDVIYPPSWLRRLYHTHKRHPGAVVAFRAHFLELGAGNAFLPYKQMMRNSQRDGERTSPRFDLMPTGVSGVLYPPGSLDSVYADQERFLLLAPSADDIWFKVSSLLRMTPCVQVEPRNCYFPFVPGSQGNGALHEENVTQGRNDQQLAACFDAYPELLKLIARPLPNQWPSQSGSDSEHVSK